MPIDPRPLLHLVELTKPRTPDDLLTWVDGRCQAIAAAEIAREPALMHRRPFKEFFEEIFPLSRFVARKYGGRRDVWVTPNLDNRNFDAVIRDEQSHPAVETLVEITTARDPEWHLRMEYLVKHRHVPLWGPVSSSGNKTNRETHVELLAVDHRDVVARHCAWIKRAAEGKASKAHHYSPDHILLIAFDDISWPTAHDLDTIRATVIESVLPLPFRFSALHLVGLSGKTLMSFSLGPGSD